MSTTCLKISTAEFDRTLPVACCRLWAQSSVTFALACRDIIHDLHHRGSVNFLGEVADVVQPCGIFCLKGLADARFSLRGLPVCSSRLVDCQRALARVAALACHVIGIGRGILVVQSNASRFLYW